jgi:hypothetical protein
MEPLEESKIAEFEKFMEKHELRRVRTDVTERIVTLVIAALGLIAALAWDETLKSLFDELFGGRDTLMGKLSYAVLITVIAAFISVQLGKFLGGRRK